MKKFINNRTRTITINLDRPTYLFLNKIKTKYNKNHKKRMSFSRVIRFVLHSEFKKNHNFNSDKYFKIRDLLTNLTEEISELYREKINGYSNFNQLARAINQIKNSNNPIIPFGKINEIDELLEKAPFIKNDAEQLKQIQKEMNKLWLSLK